MKYILKKSKSEDTIKPANRTPPEEFHDESEALRAENRFIEIRQHYGKETEKRLRDLYYIWKNPIDSYGKIQRNRGDEIAELRKFGIIKNEIVETGYLNSGTACAEYIKKTYDYPCNKDDISKWTNGKRKPPVGNKKFPAPDGNGSNRRKQTDVDDWCKVSLLGERQIESGAVIKKDAHQRKAEADARRAEMEADEMERATNGKWILFMNARSAMLGMAAILAGYQDRFAEDKDGVRKVVREAAIRCGATEEFQMRLDAELAKDLPVANDALKTQCAIEGEKCFKRFEAERKEQLKQNGGSELKHEQSFRN